MRERAPPHRCFGEGSSLTAASVTCEAAGRVALLDEIFLSLTSVGSKVSPSQPRLLQHHLRYPDAVRGALLAPREVTRVPAEPGEQPVGKGGATMRIR